ncbi:MAG: SusF/SusE family outer membrane protein [Muribaculaceae bacterium]|nr:SusF/SusE family outer membrane protein [Muribaculaceae bacterium]
MKNIIKMSLLLCGLALTTACSDDNGSNPTLQYPTQFVLNEPAMATQTIDPVHSPNLMLYCSQPDYGFPTHTIYSVQMALAEDKSDIIDLKGTYDQAKIEMKAINLAYKITEIMMERGMTEEDFPIDIPVYLRVRAYAASSAGKMIDGTEIFSNWITLKNVHALWALAPVETPEAMYVAGSFNGNDWGTALKMVQVYDAAHIFWHLVYIDKSGIKFNIEQKESDNIIGYEQLGKIEGEKGEDIINSEGFIASKNPGWYLAIITTTVENREIIYDVQFNEPNVWMIGPITPKADWSELEEGCLFEVPDDPNGEFISPKFAHAAPGGDQDGVRAYVKIPGYEWWKSEFMVYDEKIEYRGMGPDQNDADNGFGYRVAGKKGDRMFFNFTAETGRIGKK